MRGAVVADDNHGPQPLAQEQAFMAFHVLNSWEEKVEVEGTTNSVLKVVTCDMFEFDLDQNELNNIQEAPGACVRYGPADRPRRVLLPSFQHSVWGSEVCTAVVDSCVFRRAFFFFTYVVFTGSIFFFLSPCCPERKSSMGGGAGATVTLGMSPRPTRPHHYLALVVQLTL